MRVALIGPPQSGKSTLFAAVAVGGGSHADVSRGDKAHLAVVKVPDERLDRLAEQYKPKKTTHAELELLDLPGFDLRDETGRHRAKAHWAAIRQSDMLVFVVRSFPDPSVPTYRGRIDPPGDVEELLAEMLFADLDQVTNRIDKLEAAVKKPTAERLEQTHELELMRRLDAAMEEDRPISEAVSTEAEAKMIRSFAFLLQKPMLGVVNCGEQEMTASVESAATEPANGASSGRRSEICRRSCLYLSARIEREISELSAADRGEFLADLGLAAPASDRMIHACCTAMGLVTFLTVISDECRAWMIPAGTSALDAAGQIHSDIARGFIRAETVAYDHYHAAGDMKSARAAGKVRLEGKNYIVADGDIINFRFNV